jgi:hypothetical protein
VNPLGFVDVWSGGNELSRTEHTSLARREDLAKRVYSVEFAELEKNRVVDVVDAHSVEPIGKARWYTCYEVVDNLHAVLTDDRLDSTAIDKSRINRVLKRERSLLWRQVLARICG